MKQPRLPIGCFCSTSANGLRVTVIRRYRHGPARFENYLNAHNSHMDRFRGSGFVDGDTLKVEQSPGQGIATIKGEIACLGCVMIRVYKLLGVLYTTHKHAHSHRRGCEGMSIAPS